jgi:hypothetical protein
MKHLASKRQASAFFGVSTQALDGWFTAGCPVHERDKDGRIKTLDLSALARWRITRKELGERRGRPENTPNWADFSEGETRDMAARRHQVSAALNQRG